MDNCRHIPVLELIPQRPPFVWVNTLVDCDPVISHTEFTVPQTGLLCKDGFLTEAGLLEHAAQSCAARIGYLNSYLNKDTVKIGVIGTVKDFTITKLPLSGQLLETTIEVLQEVFDITLVQATISCAQEIIARGQFKIALTSQEAQK